MRHASGPNATRFGVLVVEDNPDDEELTLRALRGVGLPVRVVVARDGAQAVEMLERGLDALGLDQAPRLVLLDLKLPKRSGLEVLERLRASERTATLPVVCFTSSDEPSDVARAFALGANSFVRKPVDFGYYLEVVSKTAEYWLTLNHWPA